MPEDPNSLTLALVLTAAGATAAAGLISGVVEMLKQLLGSYITGRERLAAFGLSLLLVIVAVVDGLQQGALTLSIATVFGAFLAWYGIARLAMAVYADVSREANSLTGPAA